MRNSSPYKGSVFDGDRPKEAETATSRRRDGGFDGALDGSSVASWLTTVFLTTQRTPERPQRRSNGQTRTHATAHDRPTSIVSCSLFSPQNRHLRRSRSPSCTR